MDQAGGCQCLVTSVSPAKNCSTDRDAIWDVDLGGPKEPCIRWGPDPHTWRGSFDGEKGPAQDMARHVWWSRYWRQLSRVSTGTVLTSIAVCRWGAHWRHLANTIEPFMCDGTMALCPITLITPYSADHLVVDIEHTTRGVCMQMIMNQSPLT